MSMKGTTLAIARHMAAVLVAWLGTQVALTPDQIGDLETGLTLIGGTLLLGIYVVGEKMLKPLFFRVFGEVQPGEVPPATHDLMKAREDL
jgi:hypothetical protein